jgi:signal transduction histidine kinase
MVGFGMVYFLLDDAVRQAREENERLLAQEKARTNFLSTVSHELRTPLTSVLGYLELMEDGVGGDLSEDHAAFASEMRVGAQHLASLIDSLLDSSQISAGALAVKKQVVDLRACIGMAVSTMGTIAEKGGVTLLLELPDSLPAVVGDSQRVAQVVINLLSNAVKFTPPGGQVRVSAEIRDRCVHVAVTDTGIGIPLERQAQIFEPFFQVDNSLTREYGGSGLGLWIVKNLVTAMGGAITVESQPGNGSTFTFTLAIAPELGPTPSALRMGASAGSAPAPHSPPDRT